MNQRVILPAHNNADANVTLKSDDKSLKKAVITGCRRGAGSGIAVGRAQLNTLPSIGPGHSDFTRLTPQSNNNSFAGTNFRYDNLTIDGAINNDAFGFSNSAGGTSGGGQAGAAGCEV